VRWAGPHFFGAFDLGVKSLGRQCAFVRDAGFDVGCVDFGERGFEPAFLVYAGFAAFKLRAPIGVGLDWENTCVVGEVLKHRAVFGQQLVEHRLAVVLVARLKDVVMGAGQDLDAVQLHKAQFTNDGARVGRAGGGIGQTLQREPEVAGVAVRNT